MGIYQLSSFTVALAVLGLAVFLLRARPASAIHRWFAGFAASVAAWIATITLAHVPTGSDLPLRFAFATAGFIPATFLGFVRHFPAATAPPTPHALRAVLAVAAGLAVLSIGTPLVVYDVSLTERGLSRRAGSAFPVFAAYFITTFCAAVGLLALRWRRTAGAQRLQLGYVALAIATSGVAAMTTNLLLPWLTGSSAWSWVGPYFGLLLVGIIAHAIIRHRLLELRLVIRRRLTAALAVLVSLVPGAGAVTAFLVYWGRDVPPEACFLLLAATIAVLLAPTIRRTTVALLDRYVGRPRADFRATVREASGLLTRSFTIERLVSSVERLIVGSVGPSGVATYVEAGGAFSRASSLVLEADAFQAPSSPPALVIETLERRREPLLTQRIRPGDGPPELSATLTPLRWAVVLPVLAEDVLVGAIAVGPKRSGDAYDPRDLDLLGTLANQAGIAVRNARLYEQVVLARQYLETVLATIESGVVAVDGAGRLVVVNRAAERLTGLAAATVLGRPVGELPGALAAQLEGTLRDGRERSVPDLTLDGGGVTRPVMCTTSLLGPPGGGAAGAVAVFSDVTPIRELERERRRAERLAYFEVLAASLGHEIKNPLVAIKAFAQLMPRRHQEPRFLEEFTRVVGREIQRVERLVDRLRTLSQPSPRPPEPLDLRAPILDSIALLRPSFEEKRIGLAVDLGPEPRMVMGDHHELQELFLNLLTNARDATPPDGAVSVTVTSRDGRVAAAVADTGPGLPPAHLERIFEPFFTTKTSGSGLGLAICAGIAHRHGARLQAANRPAGGALFTLDVPVAVPAPVRADR